MTIFRFLKSFFLRNLGLKWLDLTSRPSVFSPPDVWEKWIKLADWRKVYKCWQARHSLRDDCGRPIYLGLVSSLLQMRLQDIQRPVLSDDFLLMHDNVLVVNSGSSHEDIVADVEVRLTHRMRPHFVVDEKHKLVGFALTPKLIIAGVSVLRMFPHEALEVMKKGGFRLLSKEDAALVSRQKDILSEMMKEAQVPDLSDVKSFPIELHVSEFDDRALLWHFSPRGSSHLIDSTDAYAHLLVKL